MYFSYRGKKKEEEEVKVLYYPRFLNFLKSIDFGRFPDLAHFS
jgi:hypothetical protein